jgi:hypothetical protein
MISLFYSRNMMLLAKQSSIIILTGLITGLLVFGNLNTCLHFLAGAYQLQGGYGETLSLHPNNNWLLLFPFLILMIVFPVICKEKDVRITYLLSFFPLFAMWKHSFIREDVCHYFMLVTFLFVFWGIIFIVSSSNRIFTFLTASVAILLLYANMRQLLIYDAVKIEMAGINNFREVLNYRTFKQKILSISENNISQNRLSPEIQEIIGKASVDVYPYEFSYIAANSLKWKPRKTLEIGASTSRWASQKASENFLLNKASPQFILFQTETDIHGGKFSSIDNRYILNDEPFVIYNLLNNYTLLKKTDKFLLFKRDTVSHFEDVYLSKMQAYAFGQWIDVPYSDRRGITRLKVFSKNTLLGKINKMLYKETEYFIDYQFEDGTILTYRYVPNTAVDGLWCNPFVRYPNTDEIENKVVKVRLYPANQHCVKKSFKAQFQVNTLKSDTDAEKAIFHKTTHSSKEIVVDMLQRSDDKMSQSAGFSNKVASNGYSYTYIINLDTLFSMTEADSLTVEANVRSINHELNTGLVITAEQTKEDFWDIAYLPYSMSDTFGYYSYLRKLITRNNHTSGILKIYVLNFSSSPIYIDDFRLRIKNAQKQMLYP